MVSEPMRKTFIEGLSSYRLRYVERYFGHLFISLKIENNQNFGDRESDAAATARGQLGLAPWPFTSLLVAKEWAPFVHR
jgi:hypothetical protein